MSSLCVCVGTEARTEVDLPRVYRASVEMSAAAAQQLSLVSAQPNFNAEATIKPKETFTYKYKLPVDSPRRFEWSFRVEDLQPGGSRRGADAVEFWSEAHWTFEDEEDGARTDVIKPRRPFPEARLHSDFHCVRQVDGRAEVHFCWSNVTPTPLRLSFTVRGTRLRCKFPSQSFLGPLSARISWMYF